MRNINFNNCVAANNKLWFITIESLFMSYDLEKKETQYVVPNNYNELDFKQIIDDMIYHNGCIYFVEQTGKYMYEYNIEDNYCYRYSLPECQLVNWGCFSGIYLLGEYIYMFTRENSRIYVFDINEKKLTVKESSIDEMMDISVKVGKHIYFSNCKEVIKYNIDKNECESRCTLRKTLIWMTCYESDIYLIDKDSSIYVCDKEFNDMKEIFHNTDANRTICRLAITKDKVFAFPSFSEEYIVIDKETKKSESIPVPEDIEYDAIKWGKYLGISEDDKYIWLANRICNYAVYIDKAAQTLNFYKMKDDDIKGKIKLIEKVGVVYEADLSLQEFLNIYMTAGN